MRMAMLVLALAVAALGCQAATREQVGAVEARVVRLEAVVARVDARLAELAARVDALPGGGAGGGADAAADAERRKFEEERKRYFEAQERTPGAKRIAEQEGRAAGDPQVPQQPVDPRAAPPGSPDEAITLSTAPSGNYVICSTLRDTHMTVRLWKDPHELWRNKRKAGNIEHDSKIEALGHGTNKYGTPVYKVRGRTKHNQEITGYISAFYVDHNNQPVTSDEAHADGDEWDRRGLAQPTIPYIVNPKSEAPTVNLWRDAERSDKMPAFRVPQGTKCVILETKQLELSRGGTMYLVRAETGEEGWIPAFCVEYRIR